MSRLPAKMTTRTANPRKRRRSKYRFVLSGVDPSRVWRKYGVALDPPMEGAEASDRESTTKLSDLGDSEKTISFLDESKRPHTCNISMIDFSANKEVNLLRYHCFWDRHPFASLPIGCPIRYVPSKVVKTYHSRISRDMYTIKQDVTAAEIERTSLRSQPATEGAGRSATWTEAGGYYITDGAFCSFNCCKAYIDAHRQDGRYNMSGVLLMKLYNDLTNTTSIARIAPAPSWRVLKPYGGHLSIVEFRDGMNKVDYSPRGHSSTLPNFVPLVSLFERSIKF